VLHLGCGLDTRFFPGTWPGGEWYDVDYSTSSTFAVSSIRPATTATSLSGIDHRPGWLSDIPGDRRCWRFGEGLTMY